MASLSDASFDDDWLAGVGRTLRRGWWLVALATLAGLIAAIVYLRTAPYLYTSELKVYAAPSTGGQSQVPGGLGGLAALAGVGGITAEPASPFRLYVEGVRTREVAERLARDRDLMHRAFAPEWDAQAKVWRERRGLGGSIKRVVWGVLGLPVEPWHAPDAARLQDWIGKNIDVAQSLKSPLVTISLQHDDPAFARSFLARLGATVDDYLREQQQARTASNIAYLSEKLRGVTLVEQRQALFNALSEQERQAMLANSQAPYAANDFGVATSSSGPTSPRQGPLLFAGLLGGLIVGVALALLVGRGRARPAAA